VPETIATSRIPREQIVERESWGRIFPQAEKIAVCRAGLSGAACWFLANSEAIILYA